MERLQAVYYRAPDGREPVREFVAGLTPKRRAIIINQLARLKLLTPAGPHLQFPYSSQVEGELRELRCHYASELYRVLYRRSRNLFVLLHAFRKDRSPLQRADIELAQRRWSDFLERMETKRRQPPRPAGHDAP